jgi:hypothetical protein
MMQKDKIPLMQIDVSASDPETMSTTLTNKEHIEQALMHHKQHHVMHL